MEKCRIRDKEKVKLWNKNYREKHKEEIKQIQKKYRTEHKDELKEKQHNYYSKNKEKILLNIEKYYLNNKKKMQEYKKVWAKRNHKKLKKYWNEYRISHIESKKQYLERYRKDKRTELLIKKKKFYSLRENKDKRNIQAKKKRDTDKDYLIKIRLKNLIYRAIKYYTKTGKIMPSKKYGIDYKNIINFLKPLPENLSDYEIHHIKPLYTFNFINPDGFTNLKEIKKAFAPENHKLLTIGEHRKLNHRVLRR